MGVDKVRLFTEVFLYFSLPLRYFSEDGPPRGVSVSPWLADFDSADRFPALFKAWLSGSSSTGLFTAFIGVHAATAFLRADLSAAVEGVSSLSPSRCLPRARYRSRSSTSQSLLSSKKLAQPRRQLLVRHTTVFTEVGQTVFGTECHQCIPTSSRLKGMCLRSPEVDGQRNCVT